MKIKSNPACSSTLWQAAFRGASADSAAWVALPGRLGSSRRAGALRRGPSLLRWCSTQQLFQRKPPCSRHVAAAAFPLWLPPAFFFLLLLFFLPSSLFLSVSLSFAGWFVSASASSPHAWQSQSRKLLSTSPVAPHAHVPLHAAAAPASLAVGEL